MTRRLLTLAGTIAVSTLTWSVPASAETLAAAVDRAIRGHPQVQAFDYNRRAAHAAMGAAEGLGKPRVSLSAQSGAYGSRDTLEDSAGISLSAAQTIYDAGEIQSQIKGSRADAWTAEYRLHEEILATALQTVQAYIEVQRTRRLNKLLKQNLSSLQSISSKVERRVKAGLGTQADLYQARARVESAREQIAVAEQQNADAIADYLSLTDQKPAELETVGAPSQALPKSVESAIALSSKHSPTLLATRYDALSAMARFDAARSKLKPRVFLQLNLDYDKAIDGYARENEAATAMLVLKMDLYDGGARKARATEARYQAEARKQNVKSTEREIERQMRISWNAIRVSVSKLGPLQNQVKNARQALKLNLDRFSAGMATLDTILTLQDELAAAEVSYLNEQSSYRFSVFRVLAATGRLLPALGLSSPLERAEP